MLSKYSSLLIQSRVRLYYVPWISLLSFLVVLAGTIAWGVGTSSALNNTDRILESLLIDYDSLFQTAHKISALVIAGCCILAAGMLAIGAGRSWTEYAVDHRGAQTRGSTFWLSVSAVLTTLWWMILVLLMFVFLASCVWLGVWFLVTAVMGSVGDSADDLFQYAMENRDNIRDVLEDQLGPLPIDSSACPMECLNVDLLEYFLEKLVCVCGADTLRYAAHRTRDVQRGLVTSVAGCFVVWIGTSFMLLNASADFAQARREKALLRRMQRAADDGVNGGKNGFSVMGPPQNPQLHQVVAGAGIELAPAAGAQYGNQPPYVNHTYTDVDTVPLLKTSEQVQEAFAPAPYQPAFEQSYQSQPQYEYPDQREAGVAAHRNSASAQDDVDEFAEGFGSDEQNERKSSVRQDTAEAPVFFTWCSGSSTEADA